MPKIYHKDFQMVKVIMGVVLPDERLSSEPRDEVSYGGYPWFRLNRSINVC